MEEEREKKEKEEREWKIIGMVKYHAHTFLSLLRRISMAWKHKIWLFRSLKLCQVFSSYTSLSSSLSELTLYPCLLAFLPVRATKVETNDFSVFLQHSFLCHHLTHPTVTFFFGSCFKLKSLSSSPYALASTPRFMMLLFSLNTVCVGGWQLFRSMFSSFSPSTSMHHLVLKKVPGDCIIMWVREAFSFLGVNSTIIKVSTVLSLFVLDVMNNEKKNIDSEFISAHMSYRFSRFNVSSC